MGEHTAFIGLGSNVGDRLGHLAAAREAVAEIATIRRASSIYETEPVDVVDQPWFLNQVLTIGCALSAFDLLKTCLAIERRLGRTRTTPKGPRIIDLDILLYDDLSLDEERDEIRLIIPHPRMHLRKFVLVPLCELTPSQRHPARRQTMAELLEKLDDPARVCLYAAPWTEARRGSKQVAKNSAEE